MNEDNKPNKLELNSIMKFITIKMDSLQKDVIHCLQPPFAPMPAILWCVSCVDLLGALHAGQASDKADHSANSRKYMEWFMNYTTEQAELILKVFRHKLVHLAEPGPLSTYKCKTVGWQYDHEYILDDHEYILDHLTLLNLQGQTITKLGLVEHVDQVFTLGITQFMQDIRCSVFKPGGYLDELKTDPDTFRLCKDAIREIDTPQSIKERY